MPYSRARNIMGDVGMGLNLASMFVPGLGEYKMVRRLMDAQNTLSSLRQMFSTGVQDFRRGGLGKGFGTEILGIASLLGGTGSGYMDHGEGFGNLLDRGRTEGGSILSASANMQSAKSDWEKATSSFSSMEAERSETKDFVQSAVPRTKGLITFNFDSQLEDLQRQKQQAEQTLQDAKLRVTKATSEIETARIDVQSRADTISSLESQLQQHVERTDYLKNKTFGEDEYYVGIRLFKTQRSAEEDAFYRTSALQQKKIRYEIMIEKKSKTAATASLNKLSIDYKDEYLHRDEYLAIRQQKYDEAVKSIQQLQEEVSRKMAENMAMVKDFEDRDLRKLAADSEFSAGLLRAQESVNNTKSLYDRSIMIYRKTLYISAARTGAYAATISSNYGINS
jgi:hypothetical protein